MFVSFYFLSDFWPATTELLTKRPNETTHARHIARVAGEVDDGARQGMSNCGAHAFIVAVKMELVTRGVRAIVGPHFAPNSRGQPCL